VTVVFEVRSPSNTNQEMIEKHQFYAEHGAEEYYVYDPETNHLEGYRRQGTEFRRVQPIDGYVSPRLGIKFDLSGPELVVRYPDGRPFLTFEELDDARVAEHERAETEKQRAEAERQQAEAEKQRAEAEHRRAETEHQRAEAAERLSEAEKQRAEAAERRAAALAEQLRQLGIDPDSLGGHAGG
jgi:hypothetical protein